MPFTLRIICRISLRERSGTYFNWLSRLLKLNLYLAVEQTDPTNAVRQAVKYTRTVRSVLKTCALSDFTTGLSPNNVFSIVRELTWQYGQPAKKTNQDQISANGWIVPVKLELVLKYSER